MIIFAMELQGYDRPFSMEQWLFMAEQILGDAARTLGAESIFAHIRQMLREGTSAQRQLGVYQRALGSGDDVQAALSQVVDQLLTETSQAPSFDQRIAGSGNPGRALTGQVI